jgi:hypothetical protein
MTLTLKYLTNKNVVYHNLNPKNIYIRKGLVVKINDFRNSYHQ